MKIDTILISGLFIILLSACQGDRVDVSRLSPHDRALFRIAADMEGVETTTYGTEFDWIVKYDYDISHSGQAELYRSIKDCTIKLNPNKLTVCDNGGTDQYTISVSRHEIRHCQGQKEHSDNQKSLMYPYVPCWPID